MYKKFIVTSCLIVNTHFFITAASDQMCSTSYNLCTTISSTLAVQVKPVIITLRTTQLYNLYPSVKKAAVVNPTSGAQDTLSLHSSLMQLSEDTDGHYKQHSSDTVAQNDPESSTTHASMSFTSTVDNPLELYGG